MIPVPYSSYCIVLVIRHFWIGYTFYLLRLVIQLRISLFCQYRKDQIHLMREVKPHSETVSLFRNETDCDTHEAMASLHSSVEFQNETVSEWSYRNEVIIENSLATMIITVLQNPARILTSFKVPLKCKILKYFKYT